jgi:hypothetical protein
MMRRQACPGLAPPAISHKNRPSAAGGKGILEVWCEVGLWRHLARRLPLEGEGKVGVPDILAPRIDGNAAPVEGAEIAGWIGDP